MKRVPLTDPKQCTKCHEFKSLTAFNRSKGNLNGFNSCCKECQSAYNRKYYQIDSNKEKYKTRSHVWYRDNYEAALVIGCRSRAKKKSLPCTITAADIPVPDNCPICECTLTKTSKYGGLETSPSVDMYDPTLGYIPGNAWILCKECNRRKTDLSGDKLLAFAFRCISAFKEYCDGMAVLSSSRRIP